MKTQDFLDLLDGVKHQNGYWMARCPGHEDSSSSLQISERHDSIGIHCHAGCRPQDVMEALDLHMADLYFSGKGTLGEPEAIYQYRDEHGDLVFEAVRYPGKKFRQRHEVEGEYVYSLEGVPRVLFRLPEIIAAAAAHKTVYVCEGEKDVISFVSRGHEATCNPMGAGKWKDSYSTHLVGANVVIVADKDEPGRHHAERVRTSIREAGGLVTIVEAKEGKDATDHFEAGYEVEDFVPVVERVRRGIVTAREMAENGIVHLKTLQTAGEEFVIPDFHIQRHALAFRPSRLYLLGGYTGDGKTTIALQITRRLCEQLAPPKVGFFSMEMSSDDLRNRLIEHHGLPLHLIEHPWMMNEGQKLVYQSAINEIRDWPLEIIYDTQVNAEQIVETTLDREYGFVFVDHIHRFNWGGERRTLEKEITQLTNLALDYNIPVFILAQLRAQRMGGQFEAYPRPTLASFKETSVLGEDAALAMTIWRHRTGDSQYDPTGMSELIVLKNRYGATGSQLLGLDVNRMLFLGGRPNEIPNDDPLAGSDTEDAPY